MTRDWPRFVLRSHLRPWGRRWTFVLVAANGDVVVVSEAYTTKGAALTGIAVVRQLATRASVVDETGDPDPLVMPPDEDYLGPGYGDDEEVSE